MTADALLASGPRGGPGSLQGLRHSRLLAGKERLMSASVIADEAPQTLYATIKAEERKDASEEALTEARSRLARVVLSQVQRRLQQTSLEKPRSLYRGSRLQALRGEVATAKSMIDNKHTLATREEFRRLEADAEVLNAIDRALQLQKEAHDSVGLQTLTTPTRKRMSLLPPLSGGSSPMGGSRSSQLGLKSSSSSPALVGKGGSTSGTFKTQSPTAGAAVATVSCPGVDGTEAFDDPAESNEEEFAVLRKRFQLVREAMQMLSKWKGHSEVAFYLCDALLTMAEKGGETTCEEMDRRGLRVLASLVADTWCTKPQVCRCALQLLSTVSINGLLNLVENQADKEVVVNTGLEVLNKRAKESRASLDAIIEGGGREVLDIVEPKWASHQMISLNAFNLRRHMRRSRVKSRRKVNEVRLPPEDIVRLRGCWDSLDEEERGFLTIDQLGRAFELLGMKLTDAELQEAFSEIDVDGSGSLEWPEFLWLMCRFGTGQSIDNQFSEQRLAELRDVFSIFDKDGNGNLDAEELSLVMIKLGMPISDAEVQAIIDSVDVTGTGTIEWSEFLCLMSKRSVDPENQHQLAFAYFDKHNRGRIGKEDFILSMQRLSKDFTYDELQEMFMQAKFEDTDYTTISYREFVKVMMRC
eukprot:TRINITY_DN33187_c0_g1_i1.p1 TRINITY_DN33187_c0_g1~~TRINITY_DN33187_c0_g1_i1.p1  ORF type:complete len:717 (+),score=162.13 TRINITY_DN33187_c0_g1_i1:227-2152(+)